MAKQSATVQDPDGGQWLVAPGDPAWPLCHELLKSMDFIVLPRQVILTGEVRGIDKQKTEEGLIEAAAIAARVGAGLPPKLSALLIRRIRASQCVTLLTMEEDGDGEDEG